MPANETKGSTSILLCREPRHDTTDQQRHSLPLAARSASPSALADVARKGPPSPVPRHRPWQPRYRHLLAGHASPLHRDNPCYDAELQAGIEHIAFL